MSRWIPCKRWDFVKKLRRIGFEGTYSGTRHQFMVYGQHRLTIPSNDEYSVPQLRMMIREVEVILEREIMIDEWNSL
ncbi:type II toxin-antitoxin system HicA family toxin [Nostoc sp. WHI]|uniref:type II toxin-antitoxin system HicA family toxin n=1 Tax=Nostoc sp. WHI TaxID=2650611 RepID=UPI0018C52515|nr:type II toxin-antitoxin system HicA family toxin [Nostoc sp. WHI]MBG1269209.1 type II toxin-antitoxin system HicA family toxin [Nostoc sp. WHI]